ncbi:MAG: alpha/beta hydrolase [Geminicoccaceae bacterium]|nr:alpha/beta hydrolase [Geminicoccaceae bacterium]
MFEGFDQRTVAGEGAEIRLRIGGSGPPVLLLHGYPQSHVMWHRVAPALAERFTVVCPDLRGYGDSGKPKSDPEHLTYSKRATAADMVQVMARLGFERFMLAGHDRGGRVAHRLALDHPARVEKLAVLDIVPTRTIFRATNQAIATGYYHWFFLIQPYDYPERMIGADPVWYLHKKLTSQWGGRLDLFAPEALAEYERCIRDPAMIHASCEDYRAAASIDLEHDEADLDQKLACPVLALWGKSGLMEKHFDVIETWRERAAGPVDGWAVPSGHFIPEEAPDATIEALGRFFSG